MNQVLVGVVSVVVASAVVRGAAADVVGPPRTDCVSGTIARQTHGYSYCVPDSCTTAAECTPPATCRLQGFCLVNSSLEGYCDANGRCTTGPCQTSQVCMAGSGGAGGGAGGSGGRGGGYLAGSAGTGGAGMEEWLTGRACTCRTPARDPSRYGLIGAMVVCLGSLRRCRRGRSCS